MQLVSRNSSLYSIESLSVQIFYALTVDQTHLSRDAS